MTENVYIPKNLVIRKEIIKFEQVNINNLKLNYDYFFMYKDVYFISEEYIEDIFKRFYDHVDIFVLNDHEILSGNFEIVALSCFINDQFTISDPYSLYGEKLKNKKFSELEIYIKDMIMKLPIHITYISSEVKEVLNDVRHRFKLYDDLNKEVNRTKSSIFS